MIYENVAKNALFHIADTPEEAHEIAQYLASVDWVEAFAEREQREQTQVTYILEQGGGVCDKCHQLSYEYLPSQCSMRFPGNYCLDCIRKIEKDYDIPFEERWGKCRKCSKFFPRRHLINDKSLPPGQHQYNFYCEPCLDHIREKESIACAWCEQRTWSHVFASLCRECYTLERNAVLRTVTDHNNRAIALQLEATLTLRQWQTTLDFFNQKCAYCSAPHQVLEHYLPLSLNGGTTVNNCLPSCKRCNLRKSDKHPDEFAFLFPTENMTRIRAYLKI